MLGKLSKKLRYIKTFLVHPAVDPKIKQGLLAKASDPAHQKNRWNDGTPISEARNAHYTNTAQELADGLGGDYNFMEGDVWLEATARRLPGIDAFREPIMAHDYPDVDGLTLKEWLDVGKASGKGIKLDIKQSAAIPKVIEAVQEAQIPDQSLIFNADMVKGPGWKNDTKFRLANLVMDVQTQGDEMALIRKAFPKSTIAVGLYTKASPPNTKYTDSQLKLASDMADQIGGPITFPLRAEFVNPEIVKRLKAHGSVSIWNDPKSYLPQDLEAARQEFRAMGVDGMIDLRKA